MIHAERPHQVISSKGRGARATAIAAIGVLVAGRR